MLQIVTEFCLVHLPAMQVVNILFSTVKFMQEILADDTYVCVYFSIQVQMNQWKIVWLPFFFFFDKF